MTRSRSTAFWAAIATLLLAGTSGLMAQGKGVTVEQNYLTKNNADLIAKASALKAGGKLVLDATKTAKALAEPKGGAILLPAVSGQRLEPCAIAEKGRKALIRVGWLCLCSHCDRWHVCLSGGYAISADGVVVTAFHVVSPDDEAMRESYLVAADTDGHVYPLAADKELDTAVIRIDAQNLSPLPLNDQSVPGDAAYVFSDPLSVAGYFSAGMVNRYHWDDEGERAHADTLDAARHLRLNVSTDWGPGSSGAAVLDACGNAIGHVKLITSLGFNDDGGKAAPSAKSTGASAAESEGDQGTILVLHEAVPARGVKLLIEAIHRR